MKKVRRVAAHLAALLAERRSTSGTARGGSSVPPSGLLLRSFEPQSACMHSKAFLVSERCILLWQMTCCVYKAAVKVQFESLLLNHLLMNEAQICAACQRQREYAFHIMHHRIACHMLETTQAT
jgi:hypothetical protein